MRHHWLLAAFAWATLTSSAVNAQEGKAPWEEFEKRIKTSQSIGALSDDLFGDSISLANGGLSFSATDIEIPGNADIRVAFGRRYTVFNHWRYTNTGSPLGDWDLDVPNISGVFAPNWTVGHPYLTSQSGARCSLRKLPTQPERDYSARDFWQGNILSIPGVGGGELLSPNASTAMPTSGGPYLWITADNMRVSCLQTIQNGTGEGFLAVTPDGTKYWFDWMAQYNEPMLIMPGRKSPSGFPDANPVQRRKNVLYATRVEDRFGNTVNYTYTNSWNAPAVLTKISASDGRQITLTYQSGKVRTATAGSRTWTYTYGTTPEGRTTLAQVELPDASTWQIGFSELTDAYIEYRVGSKMEPARSCMYTDSPLNQADEPVGTITHPSGAKGAFKIGIRTHGRSNVPVACYNVTTLPSDFRPGASNDPNDDMNQYVISYDSLTILAKTISGPGVTPKSWSYSYVPGVSSYLTNGATVMYPVCRPWSVAECVEPKCVSDACAGSSQTTVAETGGKWARYTFGNSYRYNDGKLLKIERGSDASHILQTETNRYDLSLSDQAYPLTVGSSARALDEAFATTHTRPLLERSISQQGTIFSWKVAAGGCPVGSHCFDDLARPLKTLHSSSIPGNPVKTNVVTYHDDPALWVIGQVKRTTTNGIETARTDYGWKALPSRTYRFGRLQSTFGYYTSGTPGSISSVTDGNGNKTWLESWKRGIPQTVIYPATADQPNPVSQKAVVDNNGWITSVTDENGYITNYTYDAMGRLNCILYPAGDSTAWNNTCQTFVPVNGPEYGIPAGHWRQTVTTGTGRKLVYFDALWRPLIVREDDTSQITATRRITRHAYDLAGRLAFTSYPVADGTPPDVGAHTTYDALDRVTSVTQDSELGPLTTTTEHLSGFQTRVTNPRGQQTLTTSYLAFDEPTYEWPRGISHPEGAYTSIYRNILSNPWAIARFSAGNAVRQTRWYVYDDHQQLCKTIEDESRATVMHYDGAGNLDWSAGGLGLASSTDCQDTDPSIAARKVTRSYDARNRIKSLVFPDHRGDTTYTYAPDSKLASITADNGGTDQVTTQYTYNKRRLMTRERLVWSSGGVNINWPISYAYNANGHLSAQSWHGLLVDYAPNGLGQPTKAGSFASNVGYYPNGAIKQFTYGNGIVHTMTQNVRQLPERSRDVYGGTMFHDDSYDYDPSGNVAGISDALAGHRGDRTMTYDGLDRMTKAVSPMFGTATYAYDVFDNLTRVKLTGGNQVRDHFYCYDGHRRLTNVKTGSCGGTTVIGMGYDVQGNLANRNGRTFNFDYGNRLRSVGGSPASSYVYDGHGRRVQDTAGGIHKYSHYSQAGQLSMTADERKVAEYIYLGGSLVAIRERDVPTNTYTTKYQHTDALGSPVAVTSQSRTVLERREYEPYGRQLRPTAMVDGVGYTGHVGDAATGLVYMQQRYYDPGIGRFLSRDPVSALKGPFNRYWYANANPYRFTDPDGRYVCTASGKGQCARVEKAVAQIQKAAKNAPEGSRIAQVSAFLGAPGEKNGVVISNKLSDSRNLGETTSYDGGGVHIGLNFGALKGNDQLSSVTMHEGSHGVDHRNPDLGDRIRGMSRSALETTEHTASTAQARMFEALNRDGPFKLFTVDGGMDWGKINDQMQRSVDWSCPTASSCNP